MKSQKLQYYGFSYFSIIDNYSLVGFIWRMIQGMGHIGYQKGSLDGLSTGLGS
jgi:hypothetical protein